MNNGTPHGSYQNNDLFPDVYSKTMPSRRFIYLPPP